MALTPESVLGIVRRRMDGDPSVPIVTLCNQAGAFIASSYEWSWLTKRATVRLPANQDRIFLPSDLGRLMPPIQPSNGDLLGTFELRLLPEIMAMRSSSVLGTSYCRFGALSYAADADGVPVPILEVYPTNGDEVVEYEFFYRARWTNVDQDSKPLPMPPWPELEAIFLDVATIYARSYDEQDMALRSTMLADVRTSPDWDAATRLDASAQAEIGPLRGGALMSAYGWEPQMEHVIPGGPVDL